jgi:RNA polymerase sigma-70 factor (ECF subfamily)
MDDARFARLLPQARCGDAAALEEIVRAFGDEVRMMVRVRLPRLLRPQFDTLDFTQCIWASVLAGLSDAEARFDSAAQFRGYLAGVARNKVLAEYRRRTRTQKYDVRREEPLEVRRGTGGSGIDEPVSRDPSPSEALDPEARLERVLRGRPPIERRVVELRSQGFTLVEIGAELDVHEKTVRRILDRLWDRLHERETA